MSENKKEQWYHRAIADLEQKYKKAKPHELKDFDGLMYVKGYCDLCRQKKALLYDRDTKKSICYDCGWPDRQYTALEMNDMWDVAHQLLYYFKELTKEVDAVMNAQTVEDVNCVMGHIIPDDSWIWDTETGKRVIEQSKEIEAAIKEHCYSNHAQQSEE